jgi:outer membrane protein assembly factor BamB
MTRIYLLLLAALAVAAAAPAADWPQFRGPNGSGVSDEKGLPLEWSATKNVLWKAKLPGPGSSSPIVFGDQVYVTCSSGYGVDRKNPGKLADLKRHLVCVARDSGKVLWTKDVDPDGDDQPFDKDAISLHGYASHTPAADPSGVYVFFGSAGAAAYSHKGERQWLVSCGKKSHGYGSAASPVLYGELMIINAYIETAQPYLQGDVIALNKKTGREQWRQKAGVGWSSPLLVSVGEKTELVLHTVARRWVGLDPENGKQLWECAAGGYYSTPVAHGGVVYVFDYENRAAIKAGGRGDVTAKNKLWQTRGGYYSPNSPVYHDGHLYWSGGFQAACADAKTGKTVCQENMPSGNNLTYASPVIADGRIYYVTRENGTIVLATGKKFQLLAHNKIEDDKSVFNGSPAVSNGCLFLRSDRGLYCIGKGK